MTTTPTTTEAVADDATEPMQSRLIEGSRSQADQAASVVRGTLWTFGGGRRVHLSQRGDVTLCGRDLSTAHRLWTNVEWDTLRENGNACKECIRWDYHLRRPPRIQRRVR